LTFLIVLGVLIGILYVINKSSDLKKGINDKNIKDTLFEYRSNSLSNAILIWLIVAVGIGFLLWFLGLG